MERIELTIYPTQAEEIENVLSEFQVPYVKTAAESYGIQVLFYIITVPSQMSGNLIEILETKVDTKDKINNIAQYNTASTISKYLIKFESFLKETDDNEIKSDSKSYKIHKSSTASSSSSSSELDITFRSIKNKFQIKEKRPIAEELIAKTDAFSSLRKDVYVMMLISTVVALVGLISNSVAIIIGAMLISPLMSPISSIALNSVLGRPKEVKQSIIFGAKLLSSSILLATAITLVLSMIIHVEVTPEIQSRTKERPSTIIVAIMLGIAGGLALITAIPEIIVGVAIAVALVPPATVTGIGIGLGSRDIAVGAFLTLFSSIIGLVIGFLIVFLLKRVRPRNYYEQKKAKQVIVINIVISIFLAALLTLIEIAF
jgi:uncharacterized hydrophobic protein (TIGR00341 family)